MQGTIVYKGKYGATREYAELLSKALDLPVADSTLTGGQLLKADYILIGSAVYIGKLQMRSWLKRHEAWLKNKKLFFFIVCGTPASDKAKTDKIIRDNIPVSLQQNPVFFLKGRMIIEKLSWFDRTMLRLGAQLVKDPQQQQGMLQDFDGVNASGIRPLVEAVDKMTDTETAPVLSLTH